ncbi:UDP-N-acetylglucosamine 4,6-dehydratase [Pseudoalteromonas sp. MSK9-3]|uniref:polysaccharide biosynthesis protein n=1 Tax=Pseudoalteromonas sp. MSK9-3 TaxID=1897633 RepID=UPI000E6CC28F|nr:polysaccharide biosynthesis protein [Pseudoalteromonas sp. MSK9-3]RJE77340.1 UDP-N-acetylglucosamine 4,6-dehydratase [Pseudoalteromonas sp. MSK9-3]
MLDVLKMIGRTRPLFHEDVSQHNDILNTLVSNARFLVIGAGGSIGQAVTKEIFRRSPLCLHAVDINENGLAELVRDLRCELGYISGEFKTFSLDICSSTYDAFYSQNGQYDYVLNLSALKHVRSERDQFTLMRMLETNVLATEKTLQQAVSSGVKKYFSVSTDKATNPANFMGASKLLMEKVLYGYSTELDISTARFANVAFSNGSLLESFQTRIEKRQVITAPTDILRYFITQEEAGLLCLISCLLGENKDIYFPKSNSEIVLQSFVDVAETVIQSHGFTPYRCDSEGEARSEARKLIASGLWPCYFSQSDTSGEKPEEEFFSGHDTLDLSAFKEIGIIKPSKNVDNKAEIISIIDEIKRLQRSGVWSKSAIENAIAPILPNFTHIEKYNSLDNKM